MKKLLLVSSFLLVSIMAKSQTEAGSFVVGGGFDFTSVKPENSNNTTNTTFSFQPSAGYFVAKNLAVGLDFLISTSKSTSPGVTDKSNSFSAGPFVRYYMFTSNDHFAFYGQADFMITAGKATPQSGPETKTGAFTFGISPGFSYFFNQHWAAELGFQGLRLTSRDPNKDVDNDKQTIFEFGANSFTPSSLGIRFYFK